MALIEIIGDDNHVLINDEYKNLIVNQKFTATFVRDPSTIVQGGNYVFTYTTDAKIIPMLAVSSDFATGMRSYTRSGNTHRWHVACEPSGIGRSADFYLLWLPESVPNANGILQLFDKNGVLVFDSNHNYCKAEMNYTTRITDASASAPAPIGRKLAHVLTAPCNTFRVDQAGPGGGVGGYPSNLILIICGIYFTNGFVNSKLFQQQLQYVVFPPSQPPPFGTTINTPSTALIIDVTGV